MGIMMGVKGKVTMDIVKNAEAAAWFFFQMHVERALGGLKGQGSLAEANMYLAQAMKLKAAQS